MTHPSSPVWPADRNPPHVDVVVPAFNEESQIDACLDHIEAQSYPADRVTVWVVDAGSTDGTAAVVAARERAGLALVAPGGRLNAAAAMNAGIARGRAPLIARVDAHTRLAPDYVERAVHAFDREPADVACVGGQPEQVGETRFGRAVALARRSPFGVGQSVYADTRTRAFVDTVQAGVYRRDAMEGVGGFAETMLVGEDEEVNWRLRSAGHRVLLDSDLHFSYTTRSSWRGVYRQYRNYGRSRVRVLAAHPSFLKPRHLAPTAFVCGLAALAGASLRSRRARLALVGGVAGYLAAGAGVGLRATAGDERALAPSVVGAFAALHLGYGLGVLVGGGELALAALRKAEPSRAVSRR